MWRREYRNDRTPRCAAPEQGKPKMGGTLGTKETEEGSGGSDQFKVQVGYDARPEERGRGNAGSKVLVPKQRAQPRPGDRRVGGSET
jgi:hypothetical protein